MAWKQAVALTYYACFNRFSFRVYKLSEDSVTQFSAEMEEVFAEILDYGGVIAVTCIIPHYWLHISVSIGM